MDLHFRFALKRALMNKLDALVLHSTIINPRLLLGWDDSCARILKVFLEEGMVQEGEVLERIGKQLQELGRSCFVQHQRYGTYPDHTISPEAFAYALGHGEFTEEEKATIRFDHGETVPSFIQSYGDTDVRERILAALMTPSAT